MWYYFKKPSGAIEQSTLMEQYRYLKGSSLFFVCEKLQVKINGSWADVEKDECNQYQGHLFRMWLFRGQLPITDKELNKYVLATLDQAYENNHKETRNPNTIALTEFLRNYDYFDKQPSGKAMALFICIALHILHLPDMGKEKNAKNVCDIFGVNYRKEYRKFNQTRDDIESYKDHLDEVKELIFPLLSDEEKELIINNL